MSEYPTRRPPSDAREVEQVSSSSYPGLGERLTVSALLFALCFCVGQFGLFDQQTDQLKRILRTNTDPQTVRYKAQEAMSYCQTFLEQPPFEVGAQSPEDSTRQYEIEKKPEAEVVPASGESVTFTLPVSGVITSQFGERTDPLNETNAWHTGIDIGADTGTSIAAAASGEVIFSGVINGYGNVIKIKHANGLVTLYGHCNELFVSQGDHVNAGDIIATVGSTGRSTGPHLHFEIIDGEENLNPSDFISFV